MRCRRAAAAETLPTAIFPVTLPDAAVKLPVSERDGAEMAPLVVSPPVTPTLTVIVAPPACTTSAEPTVTPVAVVSPPVTPTLPVIVAPPACTASPEPAVTPALAEKEPWQLSEFVLADRRTA